MLDLIPDAPVGDSTAPASAPPAVRHQPQFNGRAGEYFGIWFVNLLLGIVTLGIYSAWGKVRTQRYFYANTQLAGASFDYLASPIAILKGRLLAYAVVIALGLSLQFAPVLYFVLAAGIGLMIPALICWSLRFRARNSAWRGLSFRFDESAVAAYGPFMLWGFLAYITLSLLYPVAKLRQHEYVVEGHRFGHKRFKFHGLAGRYYPPYLAIAGMGILGFVLLVAGMVAVAGMAGSDQAAATRAITWMLLPLYAGVLAILVYAKVRYTNLLWNNASLGPHRFESSLRVRDMLWLYASNGVAIICTIGLAVPWAMVRLARYRASHFTVVAAGDLGEFFASSESRPGSAGEELVDALDVGLDIGF